jgi:deoxyribodipyrimidine photo-lyase
MISVRSVWSEIRRAESLDGVSEGSEWLRFELLWREYFRWLEKRHRESFYSERGIRNVDPQSSTQDPDKFAAWREGQTGQEFIDANMRELNRTGFMSNRGRQNVASYFIHDLGLPWLWGAAYFERMLVDADPVQNTGNWAYLAGVGADPRSFGGGARRFNVEEQADRYDPEGRYRSLWAD